MKLNLKGQKWLKFTHIFFSCLWVGGGLSLMLMLVFLEAENGAHLYGTHLSMQFLDKFVVATGGIGALVTGLLYSLFTNWGWFKHRWITVKWGITLYGATLGTFWLGPWLNEMAEIVHLEGMTALSNTVYLHNKSLWLSFGTFQLTTMVFALYLSTHRPWKKG